MADEIRSPHNPGEPERSLSAPEESRPGHQLPWPEESDPERLGEQFADPNSLDDGRLGKAFVETNSSAKKKHKPLAERVRKPESRKGLKPFREFINILLDNFEIMKVDHASIGERENDPRGGVGAVYERLGFTSCERIWTINLKKRKK